MFRKLHNHFVLTAMSLLTIVLVASFTAIYVSTATRLSFGPGGRPPLPVKLESFSGDDDFRDLITKQRKADADQTLHDLVIILVLTGTATLAAGYFISRYLADRAITPVEEAYERERRFVADASHELKTPIAVIDANIEAELVDKKKPSKWLTNIQNETGHMNTLLTELLSLAELDTSITRAATTKFNITTTINQVIEATEPLLKEKSLQLTNSSSGSTFIEGDETKIKQMIMILIDNAIKYTANGKKITIKLDQSTDHVALVVKNQHPEIPEEMLTQLFDRFYQTDESHQVKGHGLGLSIAKRIAEQSNVKLSVSQADGWVSFTLLF